MSHVLRASGIIGLPVVCMSTGEDIAEIRDVVYDSEGHKLIGFTLNKRGRFAGRMKNVLPAAALVAIGAEAVMVLDETAITQSATPDALEHPGESSSVIGNRVLSAGGDDLGKIVGVVVTTGKDPAAVGYEIDPVDGDEKVFVPSSAEIAMSDEHLLLPAAATEFIRNDLAGFGAAIDDYRSSIVEKEG